MDNKERILNRLNQMSQGTLMETLGIVYTDVGEDFIAATMPVGPQVHQPMGLLHGGATMALAESVGSAGSHIQVDPDKYVVLGIEINGNHLKSVRTGKVFALGRLIHQGKTLHLWEIRITDEADKLISLCKLTNIILPRKS